MRSVAKRSVRGERRLSIKARIIIAGTSLMALWLGWQQLDRMRRTPAASAPRAEFSVDGLDCPFWCAVRLTESIDKLDGAVVESIDQATGRVVVRHDPARQDVAGLRALLELRGYSVNEVRER